MSFHLFLIINKTSDVYSLKLILLFFAHLATFLYFYVSIICNFIYWFAFNYHNCITSKCSIFEWLVHPIQAMCLCLCVRGVRLWLIIIGSIFTLNALSYFVVICACPLFYYWNYVWIFLGFHICSVEVHFVCFSSVP